MHTSFIRTQPHKSINKCRLHAFRIHSFHLGEFQIYSWSKTLWFWPWGRWFLCLASTAGSFWCSVLMVRWVFLAVGRGTKADLVTSEGPSFGLETRICIASRTWSEWVTDCALRFDIHSSLTYPLSRYVYHTDMQSDMKTCVRARIITYSDTQVDANILWFILQNPNFLLFVLNHELCKSLVNAVLIVHGVSIKTKPNCLCHIYLMPDHITLKLSRYLENCTNNMIPTLRNILFNR